MLWQAKPQLAPRQAKIAERKAATVGLRKQYLSVYAGNSARNPALSQKRSIQMTTKSET